MCSLTLNEIPKADFKSILRNNNLFVIKALNIHNIKKTYNICCNFFILVEYLYRFVK